MIDKSLLEVGSSYARTSPGASNLTGLASTASQCKLLGQQLDEHQILTLQEMAAHHCHADFRRRALALLALSRGYRVVDICQILQVSDQPLYNWAKGWKQQGLVGILGGHKGGAPRKLTDPMLDEAAQIATQQALSLGQIAQQLRQRYPQAASFSLDRLSVGLKKRGLSYKRGRKSLKKNATPVSLSEWGVG